MSTEEAGVLVRAVACEPAPQGGQPPPSTARNRQEKGRGPEVWAAPPWRCLPSHRPAPTLIVSSQVTWGGVVSTAKLACLPERAHGPATRWGVPQGPQGGLRWQMASLARLFWAP